MLMNFFCFKENESEVDNVNSGSLGKIRSFVVPFELITLNLLQVLFVEAKAQIRQKYLKFRPEEINLIDVTSKKYAHSFAID